MSGISAVDGSYSQALPVNQVQRQQDPEEMSPKERNQLAVEESLSKTNEAMADKKDTGEVDMGSGEGLQTLLKMREITFESSDFAARANQDTRSAQEDALREIEKEREQQRLHLDPEEFAIGYNSQTAYNIEEANQNANAGDDDSRFERQAMNLDRERTLETYQGMVQKQQNEEEYSKLTMFYM